MNTIILLIASLMLLGCTPEHHIADDEDEPATDPCAQSEKAWRHGH